MKSLTIILAMLVSSAAFAVACGSSTPEPATPAEGEAAAEEPAGAAPEATPEATPDAGAPAAP
jgi:cytochrome c5